MPPKRMMLKTGSPVTVLSALHGAARHTDRNNRVLRQYEAEHRRRNSLEL